MGDRRFRHAGVRRRPVPSAVRRDRDPALEPRGVGAAPHLRPRQVVGAAEGPPHEVLHVGVEREPVGGVPPARRDAARRARPRRAAVVAAEEADVRVRDVDALWVVRIELDAVGRRDVEPARRPAVLAAALRVHLRPRPPAVRRAVRAEEVGRVRDGRVVRRHREVVGRVEPHRVAVLRRTRLDPRTGEVRRGLVGLGVHHAPGLPAVRRLRDPVPPLLAAAGKHDAAEADVSLEREVRRDGDRAHRRPRALRRSPVLAGAGLAQGLEERAVRRVPRPPAVVRRLHAAARPRPRRRRAAASRTRTPGPSVDRGRACRR